MFARNRRIKTNTNPCVPISLAIVVSIVLMIANPLDAISYGFSNITSNNATNTAIGQTQLFVDVNPFLEGALFTFDNLGPDASSITDVYFDDGTLLGIALIDDSDPGVSFSQFARPRNLPDGRNASPPFETTAGFSADSDPRVQPNGVNPGESLGILFDLQAGKFFDDVLDDLTSGALRIGIHVQGFANRGSESFVNASYSKPKPSTSPMPEPVTMLGVLMAVGALGRYIRKQRTY